MTSRSSDEVIERLEKRARLGKLAGFERRGERSVRVLVFAGAFDHEMVIELREQEDGGTRLEPSLRMLRKAPVMIWGMLVLALMPGLPLTDSMMRVYFGWYDSWGGETWWWYVPMTLLAAPVVLKQLKSARKEAAREGEKVMGEVGKAVGGSDEATKRRRDEEEG